MTCRTIAIEAIRNIAEEYLTAAAGPTSHSPPPIDVAAMTAPGPMILKRFRAPNGGGAGRSETSHGGNSPWVSGSAPSGEVGAPVVGMGTRYHRSPMADGSGRADSAGSRYPL